MKKTYVIDTNVLIQAPYALECFEDNNLVLPLVVLEELDRLKNADGEKGANARAAVRYLENLRMTGDLLKGVDLKSGGSVRVEKNCVSEELPEDLPDDKADNRILQVCKGLVDEKKKGDQILLVTKDLLLRIKAHIIGIKAEDFTTEQITDEDELYTGRNEVFVPEDAIDSFKKDGIPVECLYDTDEQGKKIELIFHENEFVILKPDQRRREFH